MSTLGIIAPCFPHFLTTAQLTAVFEIAVDLASFRTNSADHLLFVLRRRRHLPKEREPVPDPTANSGNMMGCFDCNICLDSAHDPVVTLCGHLYCWPCIYQWLRVENSAPGSEETLLKCPVCKSHISNSSLVPLYGRGTSAAECRSNESQVDVAAFLAGLKPFGQQPPTILPHAFGGYAAIAPSSFGGTAMTASAQWS
ncbi:hypothetical protein HAX54_042878 [Datura stramonium]|uniref:E3 ubiquitin-protein ligase RMA n=1 Tax=Datura stramonium TaxID=4076 RepID=A0ABS8W226_DATST|nr:hypothetical protein [Datura stramonium]